MFGQLPMTVTGQISRMLNKLKGRCDIIIKFLSDTEETIVCNSMNTFFNFVTFCGDSHRFDDETWADTSRPWPLWFAFHSPELVNWNHFLLCHTHIASLQLRHCVTFLPFCRRQWIENFQHHEHETFYYFRNHFPDKMWMPKRLGIKLCSHPKEISMEMLRRVNCNI